MKIKEELEITEFIPEEKAKDYTFHREGYDFLKINSIEVMDKMNYKWLLIPLIFFLLFVGFGGYGYYDHEILGNEINMKLMGIAGISSMLLLFTLMGFVFWRDYKENKEERKYEPKLEIDMFIPIKKPYEGKFEIGDKLNCMVEIEVKK